MALANAANNKPFKGWPGESRVEKPRVFRRVRVGPPPSGELTPFAQIFTRSSLKCALDACLPINKRFFYKRVYRAFVRYPTKRSP
jgi:hypothetical protein